MTERQGSQFILVAAGLGAVSVFLPLVNWEGGGGYDGVMEHQPLPFIVHLPLLLVALLMAARLAGRTERLPLGMTDRGVAAIVGMYGVLAYGAMLLTTGMFDEVATPGIGFWATLAASLAVIVAAFIGDRTPAAVSSASVLATQTERFDPAWVALAAPMALDDGRELPADTWYLAVRRSDDGLVLQLDDGREVLVAQDAVLQAAAS